MGGLLLLLLQKLSYVCADREENVALTFYAAAQMKLVIGAMHTGRKGGGE